MVLSSVAEPRWQDPCGQTESAVFSGYGQRIFSARTPPVYARWGTGFSPRDRGRSRETLCRALQAQLHVEGGADAESDPKVRGHGGGAFCCQK